VENCVAGFMPEVSGRLRCSSLSHEVQPTMSRLAAFSISILFLCAAGVLLSLNGCGGSGGATFTGPPPASKIQHVVIIFQENRTPDNLFQDPVLIANGADIQNYGVNAT
jgi:phospholipase C